MTALLCVGGLSAVALPARADTPSSGSSPAVPTPPTPTSAPSQTAPAGNPPTQPPAGPPSDAAPDESAASVQAQETGQPVEVAAETTETVEVNAEPDGSFTSTTSLRPVRVQRSGGWVPVDTTLARNPNGTYAPVASAVPMTFGGGGTRTLVTLGAPGAAVTLSWPNTLPTPTLSGSSVTYPAVFPGVDLRLNAQAEGYTEVLVIHDATAAANPALAHLTFTAAGDGVTVQAAGDGGVSAVDTDGAEVFHAAAPVLWDSAGDPQTGPAPTADDAGSGHLSPVALAVTPGALTLTPPAGALTGPGVTYPVYLDPGMTAAHHHYAVVTSGGTHYYDDASQDAKVGDCDWPGCNGIGVARSYFDMNAATITGRAVTAQIHSAVFAVTQTHNANACTAQPVDLHRSPSFTNGITWPGPAGVTLQEVSANYSDTCPSSGPNNLNFSNSNVVSYVQEAADHDWASIDFALIAPNEGQKLQWKRFATNPTLTIHYNFPPSVPTNLKVSNAVTCNGTVYTADAFPTLYATGRDNNPSPLQLNLWFELWPTGGSARTAWNTAGVRINSGTQGGWTTNKPGGVGNGNWSFRVHDENLPPDVPHLSSAWSGWYAFVSRANPPSVAPWVSSYDYPSSVYWGPPTAAAPTFLLNANGAPNVAGFAYTWAGAGTEPALRTTDCSYTQTIGSGGWVAASGGTATLAVPGTLAPGYHTLYVRSFDDAHNLSPESTPYTFYIAPTFGVSATRLESDSASVTLGQPAGQTGTSLAAQTGSGLTWSGGRQELFSAAAANTSFTLTFGTPTGPGGVPLEADYALGAKVSTDASYGQLRFDLDGVPLAGSDTAPKDTYSATPATVFLPLGGTHLVTGTHQLKVTVVGRNPASTAFNAGIDYLTAIPFNNVTTASFTAAMNNHGIAFDNTTAADLDLVNPSNTLSRQALDAAGYTAGARITIGGATFTLPAASAATGNDNVIAAGQTVPLPAGQQVKATAVGLLALATCGATPATHGAITYTDGSTSSAAYVSVPDWIVGPATAATAVLDHRDVGAAPDPSWKPRVYGIFLPTDPRKTVKAVTLPNIGTSFLPGACPIALHVLAIAPRPVDAGWIGTWAATTGSAAAPAGGAGFANQTLRMVVHPTVTGASARIRLTNSYAPTPVTIDAASLAAQSGTGAATLAAPATLSFCAATGQAAGCGVHTVTLPAGGEAYSDPVTLPATAGGSGNLTVSLHLPTAVATAPVHPAGNTTNYLAAGNQTAAQAATAFTTTTTNSYYLAAVDVSTTDSTRGTIAVIGDQASATGAPGGTYQPTWVDDLPAKLGPDLPGGLVNASLPGQPASWWRGSEVGTPLNQAVLVEPNLRTVLVTLGAQDILQNAAPADIRLNIRNLLSDPASAYGIRNYSRADGSSAVHVILATVPPLGLSPTDQREANRRALNADILAHVQDYGASEVVDFDAATRDAASPNAINPAYLTAGSPNAAYYDALAQALTDAVETFPPTAQL